MIAKNSATLANELATRTRGAKDDCLSTQFFFVSSSSVDERKVVSAAESTAQARWRVRPSLREIELWSGADRISLGVCVAVE